MLTKAEIRDNDRICREQRRSIRVMLRQMTPAQRKLFDMLRVRSGWLWSLMQNGVVTDTQPL